MVSGYLIATWFRPDKWQFHFHWFLDHDQNIWTIVNLLSRNKTISSQSYLGLTSWIRWRDYCQADSWNANSFVPIFFIEFFYFLLDFILEKKNLNQSDHHALKILVVAPKSEAGVDNSCPFLENK